MSNRCEKRRSTLRIFLALYRTHISPHLNRNVLRLLIVTMFLISSRDGLSLSPNDERLLAEALNDLSRTTSLQEINAAKVVIDRFIILLEQEIGPGTRVAFSNAAVGELAKKHGKLAKLTTLLDVMIQTRNYGAAIKAAEAAEKTAAISLTRYLTSAAATCGRTLPKLVLVGSFVGLLCSAPVSAFADILCNPSELGNDDESCRGNYARPEVIASLRAWIERLKYEIKILESDLHYRIGSRWWFDEDYWVKSLTRDIRNLNKALAERQSELDLLTGM